MGFDNLGLSKEILDSIKDLGFTEPTEIQEKAIPVALEGKDLVAGSATGSGKTLVFGAGIIQNIVKGSGVVALILTPTRELCEQVSDSLKDFSKHRGLEIASVYGGVSIENQIKKLQYADIVVATPGRLLDHMQRNSISLSKIRFLVLDEADRMWDMGFQDDVSMIVHSCPKDRQTLLFSATISSELESFKNKYMKNPVEVAVNNQVDPSKLRQVYYDAADSEKFSLLVHLLKSERAGLVMVFCNTRRNAEFISKNLRKNGIDADVVHGGMSQSKRENTLEKFDNSKVTVLVCTDLAARGLDIEGVSHVYNYDVPEDAKDYIHRVGRTARAGKEGIAINILASRDYDNFSNFQRKYPEIKVERIATPEFEKVFVKWDDGSQRGRVFGNRDGRRFVHRGEASRKRFGSFGKKHGERSNDSSGDKREGFRGRRDTRKVSHGRLGTRDRDRRRF